MIVKESFKTENGSVLFRTYSDTGYLIRNTRTGRLYSEALDISDEIEYEETEKTEDIHGVSTYGELIDIRDAYEMAKQNIKHIPLTDNEALSLMELYPKWEECIGKLATVGDILCYGDNLFKVLQPHTIMVEYPPTIYTASLYSTIVFQHEGTMKDPIPYSPPMEIFEGKYYKEDGVLYLCNRSSGISLSHSLASLIGIYVIVA